MGQEVKVTTERIDDIPLLLEQLLRMGSVIFMVKHLE